MGKVITEGSKVRVTGVSSMEKGAFGEVKSIKAGWIFKEAVVQINGALRPRTITVPLSDLTPA